MSTEPAYSIRSLVHSYDGRIVLDIPRLDIPSGQICAIVGPNGCGKTTLLSILALLLQPISGSVLLHGVETVRNCDRKARKTVTLVHQKPVLFSTTVRNSVFLVVSTVSLVLILGGLASFSLARLNPPGSNFFMMTAVAPSTRQGAYPAAVPA